MTVPAAIIELLVAVLSPLVAVLMLVCMLLAPLVMLIEDCAVELIPVLMAVDMPVMVAEEAALEVTSLLTVNWGV